MKTFNLIIGNNDSHSKNISFLLENGKLRLSPFYDLLSTAVYSGISRRFAFGLGKKGQKQYYWYKLRGFHLEKSSKNIGVHRLLLKRTLLSMVEKIERELPNLINEMENFTQNKNGVMKIVRIIKKRAQYLKKSISEP